MLAWHRHITSQTDMQHLCAYLRSLIVWHGHIRSLTLHSLGTGNTLGLAAGIEGSCVGAEKHS